MFLTRMSLDESRPETRELLADPDRLLMTARLTFAGGNLVPLFRLDRIGSRLWLVMMNSLRPNMHMAHARYGYSGVFPSWETFCYDDDLEQVTDRSLWQFELAASPSGVLDVHDRVWEESTGRLSAWLEKTGLQCGFELLSVRVERTRWVDIGGQSCFYTRFTGTMLVTDSYRFLDCLCNGIGGARNWGAGLMTIARTSSVWA